MRAISLLEPWASLVAVGAKRYETRSWGSPYRGPLAIHASKSNKDWAVYFRSDPFASALRGVTPTFGAIIAVANLVDVVPIGPRLAGPHVMALPDYEFPDLLATADVLVKPAEHEHHFGNYTPGRFAWIFDDVRRLKEPLPCRGMLGLWEVPAEVTP